MDAGAGRRMGIKSKNRQRGPRLERRKVCEMLIVKRFQEARSRWRRGSSNDFMANSGLVGEECNKPQVQVDRTRGYQVMTGVVTGPLVTLAVSIVVTRHRFGGVSSYPALPFAARLVVPVRIIQWLSVIGLDNHSAN